MHAVFACCLANCKECAPWPRSCAERLLLLQFFDLRWRYMHVEHCQSKDWATGDRDDAAYQAFPVALPPLGRYVSEMIAKGRPGDSPTSCGCFRYGGMDDRKGA